jgi:DNA-binding GntR family transcriptional regulator
MRGNFKGLQAQMKEMHNLIKAKEALDAKLATLDLGRKQMDDYDRTMNQDDLDEIIEARVILESAAARRVADIWSAEDTQWMEANIAAQTDAVTLSDLSRLDVELHLYVMRRAGNARLLRMWQIVRWQFEMCLAMAHRLQETLSFKPHQITVNSHRRLLAALASGKPELAATTMASHIESSREWTYGDSGFGTEPASTYSSIK